MSLSAVALLRSLLAVAHINGVSAGYVIGIDPSGALPVVKSSAASLSSWDGATLMQERIAANQLRRRSKNLVRRGAMLAGDHASLVEGNAKRALTCSSVMDKARNMVAAYKEIRSMTQGVSDPAVQPDGWLYLLEQQLEASLTGPTVLDSFYRVLNAMDLGAGLRYGEVWTIQHADTFYQCNGLSGSLEVQGPTHEQKPFRGSIRIKFCGGDMVCSGHWANSSSESRKANLKVAKEAPHRSPSRWGDGHQRLGSARGMASSNGTGHMNISKNNPSNSSDAERSNASGFLEVDAGEGPRWDRKLWEIGPLPRPPREHLASLMPANSSGGSSASGKTTGMQDSTFVMTSSYTREGNVTAHGRPSNASKAVGPAPSPGYGLPFHEVPYCFSDSILSASRDAFLAAIAEIQQQVPCISFRVSERYSDRDDCVEVPSILVQSDSVGCWSHVGQVSGSASAYLNRSQPLNIGQGCGAKGLVVHQLGHTLGLLHEVYRPDRNDVLSLQKANMQDGRFEESFQIVQDVNMHVDAGASSADAGFDFLSVMMYGAFSFSANGLMVSKPRDLRVVGFMGQRMGLSELDARVLAELYGCSGNVTPTDSNAFLSDALRNAAGPGANQEALIGSGYQLEGDCQDSNSTGFFDSLGNNISCGGMRSQCSHTSLGPGIRQACPRTCHECVPSMWPTMTSNCLLCEDVAVHGWHAR